MGDRLPEQTRANPSPAVAASSEAEAIEVLETEDVLPMATEDNHRVGRNQSSSTPTCCPKARLPTHRPPTDQPLLSRTQSDTSRGQKHARKFDPENTGYISTEKFRNLLQRHGSELDPHKLEVLLALADNNSDGKICYQDFVNLRDCAPCQDSWGTEEEIFGCLAAVEPLHSGVLPKLFQKH